MYKAKSLIFIVFLYYLLPTFTYAFDAKMVMYVAPVRGELPNIEKKSKAFTAKMRSYLTKSSQFVLVNPSETEDIKFIKTYNQTCTSTQECARKEAKANDAELVLTTEIVKLSRFDRCRIIMKLENIYKNEFINSVNVDSSCDFFDLDDKVMSALFQVISNKKTIVEGDRDAYITTVPAGAKVIINNNELGTTPLKTRVPLGEVTIQLEIEGSENFAPIILRENIKKSDQVWKYHKIFAQRKAYLKFKVKPSTASLEVNGKKYKVVPKYNIPVNTNQEIKIKLTAKNYKDYTSEIDALNPDEKKVIDIELEPKPCELRIGSSPSGADVIVNGENIGDTPVFKKLTPGDLKVTVSRRGYDPLNFNMYCSPNSVESKTLRLIKSKYNDRERALINKAKKYRKYSYYAMGLSLATAYMAYSAFSDYQDVDSQYASETDPFKLESLRSERDSLKGSVGTYSLGTILLMGASYYLYKKGEFPDELRNRSSFHLHIDKSTKLVWNYRW